MENVGGGSELIRVSKPTKELLAKLKIVESETYGNVINRILQTKFEDMLSLNQETHALLDERMKCIRKGEVYSHNELLQKIKKKRKEGVTRTEGEESEHDIRSSDG